MNKIYGAACYIPDYPRPQFVRKEWINLNGAWSFCFDDNGEGGADWPALGLPGDRVREIQVPFPYETAASGIGDETVHFCVWYEKSFSIAGNSSKLGDGQKNGVEDASELGDGQKNGVEDAPEQDGGRKVGTDGKRLLLHFEGSDFETTVWINGKKAGSHRGGYERFSFDITDSICAGENRIVVCVKDSLGREQPRGKQRWMKENFACWYVQTTGIWKTVWMEWVPEAYLERVKLTPDLQRNEIEAEVSLNLEHFRRNGCGADGGSAEAAGTCGADMSSLEVEAVVFYHGELTARARLLAQEHLVFRIGLDKPDPADQWGVHLWSPDAPNLYDMELRLLRNGKEIDRADSYFGMREVQIKDSQVLLNGAPVYQKLILDQGYWEESHLTPPSEQALIEDIDRIHELGYNGLRKHQKLEDERFLYWCDVKGMLVWSEMAAFYSYSDAAVEQFTREWAEIVRQNYNHPSIITWVPLNESWGIPKVRTDRTQQCFTEAIYYLTKSLDPMRPVVVNDGWEHTVSDLLTLHDYEAWGDALADRYLTRKEDILAGRLPHCKDHFALAEGYSYRGQPVLISEYGGIAFAGAGEGWGYGDMVKDEEEFIRRFDSVTSAIKALPYVCGYCYTQVSDVQQEINGLMTADRKFKVDPSAIREINMS